VRTCSIDGCGERAVGRGWCGRHYVRWRTHGDPLFLKKPPNGAVLKWIDELIGTTDQGCIDWPFSYRRDGYGQARYLGRMWGAHLLICTLAHGAKPSRGHEAAHNCGRQRCVNPTHLRWATHTQNAHDMRQHGTLKAVLERSEVRKIRRLLKLGQTQRGIAALFNVSQSTIWSMTSLGPIVCEVPGGTEDQGPFEFGDLETETLIANGHARLPPPAPAVEPQPEPAPVIEPPSVSETTEA
jgi:hypothetical protein